MTDKRILTTPNAKMFWDKRGFVYVILLNNTSIFDKTEAEMHYEFACKLSGNKSYRTLVDTTDVAILPNDEAQDYSVQSTILKKAEAIVVNSLPMRIVTKFYVKRFSTCNAKLFKNKEDAISWLLKQPL